MDTRWKNRSLLILWLVLFTYGISGVLSVLNNNYDFEKQSYFKTSQFEHTIDELLTYVNTFEISNVPKEEIKKSITVTNEEIEEHRYRYGDLQDQIMSIEDQYESRIEEAQSEQVAELYRTERDKKIEDITKNFESDEHIKEKIIIEREQEIDVYFEELETYKSEYQSYKEAFFYYLRNTATGEVYTNLPISDSKEIDKYINEETTHFINKYPSKSNTYLSLNNNYVLYLDEGIPNEVNLNLDDLYEGTIAVKKSESTNFILANYDEFKNQQKLFWGKVIAAIIALFISVFIGKKLSIMNRIQSSRLKVIAEKLPIDVACLFFGFTTLVCLLFFNSLHSIYSDFMWFIFELGWLSLFVGLSLVQGIYLYPRVMNVFSQKENLENTLTSKFINMVQLAFVKKGVGWQVSILLTIVFVFGAGFGLVLYEPELLLVYIPVFIVLGLPIFLLIVKRTAYFNEITSNTNALAKGHFEPDLKITGKSVLAKLAEDINSMKHGVKRSQKEQVKSERLKTELITNVSHDLRTPLTSIITYSELLKNPNLEEDERKTYIEIIDRKSKRLKSLIDDLFEASKMASGNIELSKAKVDVVQLLQQALAEYNESIQESTIQFRVMKPEGSVFSYVDGQKLWRVFDNLIGNILKYSLEHTRAYIQVKEENNQVCITFKNISKYELNDDVEELFERFKRGDKSRQTEGSGLGLAIAKSIIDLHEGQLNIDVDGDLYKVTILLNKIEE
ncbi:signal transduction histidine kinase [Metabacillus crassostreae]|uniref:HAMP domain-containing sensor histidine kinase n=1 Tax=Metabacillus crassostreae TaxID=929098 RepID=UPI00195A625D|nr:MFS domain-containing histidine kinase [Metabacillus crassostreae]MBM7603793.1 signal transduction histidine kinase [Metabacillus crassostreae]